MEWVLRFVIGGLAVSLFAVLGDLLRPKSFAGLFGAAPSVAVATLALTFSAEGASTAAIEARAMMLGAVALGTYSIVVCQLLARSRVSVTIVSTGALLVWLGIALGLHAVISS
jgi:Protein of unknown function (DUF3147)